MFFSIFLFPEVKRSIKLLTFAVCPSHCPLSQLNLTVFPSTMGASHTHWGVRGSVFNISDSLVAVILGMLFPHGKLRSTFETPSMFHPVCESVQLWPFGWRVAASLNAEQFFPARHFSKNNSRCKNLISEIANELSNWKISRLLPTCQKLMWAFRIIASIINPLQCSPSVLIYRTQAQPCCMFCCRCLTCFLFFLLIPGGNKLKPDQTKNTLMARGFPGELPDLSKLSLKWFKSWVVNLLKWRMSRAMKLFHSNVKFNCLSRCAFTNRHSRRLIETWTRSMPCWSYKVIITIQRKTGVLLIRQ